MGRSWWKIFWWSPKKGRLTKLFMGLHVQIHIRFRPPAPVTCTGFSPPLIAIGLLLQILNFMWWIFIGQGPKFFPKEPSPSMSTATVQQTWGRNSKYIFIEFWQIIPKSTLAGKWSERIKSSTTKGTSKIYTETWPISLSFDPNLSDSTYFSFSSNLRGFME